MPINKLRDHLCTHQDAMIILGSNATKELLNPIDESVLNKKTLRRDSKKFWDYFREEVFLDPEKTYLNDIQNTIKQLNDLGVIKSVICQGQDGLLSGKGIKAGIIDLKGSVSSFVCQNSDCSIEYPYNYFKSFNDDIEDILCEECGTQIRPDMLFAGENYNDDLFHDFKELLLNTHTLIVIDIDTREQVLLDLIADFGDVKESVKGTDDAKQLVVIHNEELELDFNEIAFCDFLVKDDPEKAIDRLYKGIKG